MTTFLIDRIKGIFRNYQLQIPKTVISIIQKQSWLAGKSRNLKFYLMFGIISLMVISYIFINGCASTPYRFAVAEPVTINNDNHPIAVPQSTKYEKMFYGVDVLVRRPIIKSLEFTRVSPARDINSMDDVPSSTWFTPRLGYKKITPEVLLRGPEDAGAPKPPIIVVKAKTGGANPGFIIEDVRGERYLMKFDPPEFPAIETTTALIVNRLFWGFGYNVPEDYLFFFSKDDLKIDPKGELTEEDVAMVLNRVSAPVNGVYRSTVSRLIDGIFLGPVPNSGIRKGDTNDKIPHENRRILRALRMFSAFTNHTDIRIDNSVDVYVGKPGMGYVKHYLLDFGEAFGGHGAEHDYMWDGFNHWFSFSDLFENLFTGGLLVHDWEAIQYTPWKSVGAFESKVFEPAGWKEVSPYEPIRRSQPADDYWAAKILGALTKDHITALVKAAKYPETGASEYIIKTLLERRRKVLEYSLGEVSPVDAVGISGENLELVDMGIFILKNIGQDTRYEVRFYDDRGKEIVEKRTLAGEGDHFTVPVSRSLLEKADSYLRVDVWVWRGSKRAPTAAQFHLRVADNSLPRLVGVVH